MLRRQSTISFGLTSISYPARRCLHVLTGELRGGIDDGAGADEEHAVALAGLVDALSERVRGIGSPNMTVSPLTMPLCIRRHSAELVEREPFEGPAVVAEDAAELRAVAVDLGDLAAAGELVEVVDVLGDDVLELPRFLEVAEGEVAGVGHGGVERLRRSRRSGSRAPGASPTSASGSSTKRS